MFATVTVCEKSEYRFRRFHWGVPDERVVLVIDEIKVTIPLLRCVPGACKPGTVISGHGNVTTSNQSSAYSQW